MNHNRSFKPTLLAAAALLVASLGFASSAQAVSVTYSTLGCFGAGCTPVVDTAPFPTGNASLMYDGNTGTTVDANPTTFADFGSILTAATDGGGTFTTTPFTLQISQTVPTVGTGNLAGTISGTITPTSSGAVITFTTTQVVIGGVTYAVANNPLALVAPSSGTGANQGRTTIQGQITAVPEPASMTLLGTGLLGLVRGLRRKK